MQLGFPTTHNEEWRFTNVAPIARITWAAQAAGTPAPLAEAAEQHLGQYASLDNTFVALNTAFLNDVKVVQVPKNTVVEAPIEITYDTVDEGAARHPRTLVLVGAGSQCTIVETYKGTGTYFTNAVTEIVALVVLAKVTSTMLWAWAGANPSRPPSAVSAIRV